MTFQKNIRRRDDKRKKNTVLELPPYYCVLNAIDLIWNFLQRGI